MYKFKISLFLFSLVFCLTTSGQENYPACHNSDFSFNTEGWKLFWLDNNYSQDELLSTTLNSNSVFGEHSIASIPESSNSIQGSRIAITDVPEYIAETNWPNYSLSSEDNLYIRIGGDLNVGYGSEEIQKEYAITAYDQTLQFTYTAILEHSSLLTPEEAPFFKYSIQIQYADGQYFNGLPPSVAGGFISSFQPFDSNGYLFEEKRIYNGVIELDLSDYPGLDICKKPIARISFMVSDSKELSNIGAKAYIHQNCFGFNGSNFVAQSIENDFKFCTNTPYSLQINSYLSNIVHADSVIKWTVTNIQTNESQVFLGNNPVFTFPSTGNYSILLIVVLGESCEFMFTQQMTVGDCDGYSGGDDDTSVVPMCDECTSFNLIKNHKYLISGWAKLMQSTGQDNFLPAPKVPSYSNIYIGVTFLDVNEAVIGAGEVKFYPIGQIIDGWQKIQGEVVIPQNAVDYRISLVNENSENVTAFFDDIRVHPFNGNLKSFVYDQATQRLMAELDENNYATFYEYDKEGGLVRVKKETERGVYTIQETRSSTKKTAQ